MYASLGDIVFQTLISFDSLSDKRETKYSQLALINGKPTLQRTGESLVEFSMGIMFHVAFCNPEDEFLKLDQARRNGDILPFLYGNGFNEGSFVITNIERTINQTDGIGNFVEIVCNVSLLECVNGNTDATQLEQDKKNAFAISANRPLPAKTDLQTDNPALMVCEENKNISQAAATADEKTNSLKGKVDAVISGLIDKAQAFVDTVDKYTSDINAEILKTNTSISLVNNMLVQYTSLGTTAPGLSTAVAAVQAALSGASAQLIVLGALPNPITTTGQANSALSELTTTLNVIKTLKDNTKAMTAANSPIAKALATKRVMT